ALYLMEQPPSEAQHLADALTTARGRLRHCCRCFNYSEDEICAICSAPGRDGRCICVVEKPVDVFAMERGGRYRGVYHILGGVLAPLHGITVEKLRIRELSGRIETGQPEELIIALGGSADAEATALYLARLFKDKTSLRITRLARGLPAGMELEYADQITLSQALNERTDIHYGKD
ncbi:MAG: recombination protein RecR, partial [Chitinispirillaceae bacterium]|nr:recombination protein RecR [Chitinispirillaceae bacterium]